MVIRGFRITKARLIDKDNAKILVSVESLYASQASPATTRVYSCCVFVQIKKNITTYCSSKKIKEKASVHAIYAAERPACSRLKHQ